jgi:hypothetical protein
MQKMVDPHSSTQGSTASKKKKGVQSGLN